MEQKPLHHSHPELVRPRSYREHEQISTHIHQAYQAAHEQNTNLENEKQRPQTYHPIPERADSSKHKAIPCPHRWSTTSRRDSLEEEQTGRSKHERREREGSQGGLSELAVPGPVDRQQGWRDSLEEEQTGRSKRERREREGSQGGLSELAVPDPVDRQRGWRNSLGKERAGWSPCALWVKLRSYY